ncbi:MAG TPA: DUF3078 domain-containing protein [Cyclobacteriaceae bacterium]|nr:DUF3078 domain-containing protein [Cyclobacteriaceae bacterium]
MKQTFCTLAFLFYAGFVFAQDTANPADTTKFWKTGGQIGLSFSQVSLTNWAAGGENSLSTNGLLRLTAVYTKDRSVWDSYILAGYGFSKQGDRNFIKNDDRMELFSKYGYQAGKTWYYTAVINFRSQFTPGYSNPYEQVTRISDFFSPAYLTASLGMDYKPNEFFSVFISPATLKMTVVNDDSLSAAGAYGVDSLKTFRGEGGGFVKVIFKKDNLIKNVNLSTTLDLFSNYFNNPEKIDVNWEVFIAMKVTKLLTVTLNTQLLYDYDIRFADENDPLILEDKVQFKEVFGLGLAYSY